jgi:hypothetical protein
MRLSRCPKCGHAPLPEDQSLPAACPSCGLVLAKFADAPTAEDLREKAKLAASIDEETGEEKVTLLRRIAATATYIPARVNPVHFWARAIAFALLAAWSVSLIAKGYADEGIFSSWIHGPLLVFHEAGHVIFSIGGQFMAVAGGTLGQLIMPAILAGALLMKNRDTFGGAVGVWFFGVSLLDVAPYVYDALKPQLILLGGHTGESGGHDWIYLLDTLGLLGKAQTLGSLTHKLGALVVIAALAWAGWVLWQQKQRLGGDFDEG